MSKTKSKRQMQTGESAAISALRVVDARSKTFVRALQKRSQPKIPRKLTVFKVTTITTELVPADQVNDTHVRRNFHYYFITAFTSTQVKHMMEREGFVVHGMPKAVPWL